MGIPGLINALGPGERISLSKLAVSHLERTSRPIRIAVDISIWLFQVQAGRGGKNPELRTLFYRLLKILALPIHPLFVYDGKDKPPFKRGKAVSGRSYGNAPIIHLSKILIDLFKFPRHDAPGEAEAECARLQMAGVVDAVMSNDVDALMFGSALTIMNFSKESGSGSGAATHVTCYDMRAKDTPNLKLDRPGMILFAMLSGGDYLPSGVPKCGSKLAAEIAKAGFGADLLEALKSGEAELDSKLAEWRERLQYELEENESGYFQTKHKVVRIPETFPDRTILSYYANPIVSTEEGISSLRDRLHNAWDQDIDVVQIRQFVADAFEWNYRSGARKVIRLLAEPLVSQKLRLGRHPLGLNRLSQSDTPILHKVYKSRTSFSTDGMTELQLDMIPVDIVGLDLLLEEPNPPMPSQDTTVSGGEEEGEVEVEDNAEATPQSPVKKRVTKRYDPYSLEKIWVFETLASMGIPEVVEKWKNEQAAKQAAKQSVPKKANNRKSGPKKKKELDPGMKQGSILKYGTLTKGRSEISEYKQTQFFEAAVSTASPTKSPQFSSPGRYGLQTMSATPNSHNQPLDGFDYLINRFSSCSISPPSPRMKSRPTRSRTTERSVAINSSGAEVEVLELSSDESPLTTPSRRIRMSYLNSSYKSLACDVQNSQVFDITSTRPNYRLVCQSERRIPPSAREPGRDAPLQQLGCDAAKKPAKRKQTRPSKKSTQIQEADGPEPCTEEFIPEQPLRTPSMQKCRGKTAKEQNIDESPEEDSPEPNHDTKPTGSGSDAIDSHQKPPTHLESITLCDGYWAVDPAPEKEESILEDVRTGNGDNDKRSKKKRIPRVSILDLI